jgi:hypothetical protein
MTAWGIGYRSDEVRRLSGGDGLGGFINRVVEWIPADIVALYAAAVTYLEESDSNPNKAWFYVFLCATPIVSWLGVLAARRPFGWRALIGGVLACGAFAIWSASVPNSGWWAIGDVAENPQNVAIASVLGGLIFGLVAKVIHDRLPAGKFVWPWRK